MNPKSLARVEQRALKEAFQNETTVGTPNKATTNRAMPHCGQFGTKKFRNLNHYPPLFKYSGRSKYKGTQIREIFPYLCQN